MPISKIGKIAIATVSAGGVSGGVAYGYHEFTKITLRDKLGKNLIKTTETDKWRARAATLKADTTLSNSLKAIQDKNDDTGSKIKEWCEANLENKFVSEDQGFKEVQKYCAYNIKDQITRAIAIDTWNNNTHNNKLKNVDLSKITLSLKMAEIKNELTKSDSPNLNALRDWCKEAYEKPFKDNKDQEYLDANIYCTPS